MILGRGDIASVLPTRDDLLFFASGVSNSQEKDEAAYRRERLLLFSQNRKQQIVYFSTLSIFYNNNRYTKHKMEMEDLIKGIFSKYTIIRIGNINWGTNPHTLINFMKNRLDKGEPVEIKDEYRYIVNKDEFLYWIGLIPTSFSCEMNIPGKRMKVQEIVEKYCISKYPVPKDYGNFKLHS